MLYSIFIIVIIKNITHATANGDKRKHVLKGLRDGNAVNNKQVQVCGSF